MTDKKTHAPFTSPRPSYRHHLPRHPGHEPDRSIRHCAGRVCGEFLPVCAAHKRGVGFRRDRLWRGAERAVGGEPERGERGAEIHLELALGDPAPRWGLHHPEHGQSEPAEPEFADAFAGANIIFGPRLLAFEL